MQGGVAGLKRRASQMSGASFGSAISRGSAASGASTDSKVTNVRFVLSWHTATAEVTLKAKTGSA